MSRMSFDQVIEFIMERLDVKEHDRRATRDKVRKRVRYGLGDGSLPRIDLQTMDVDRNELILFARKKWPGYFEQERTVQHADCFESVGLTDKLSVQEYPADVNQCHDLIRQKNALLSLLMTRARVVDALMEQWRPIVKQYESNCAKNRESARKPRSGNI